MTEQLAALLGPVLGATTVGAPWSTLAMSFGLGIRHATEPDHVVAVTTMATGTRSLRAAGRIGILWGLGHSATVLVVGAIVLSLGRTMPDAAVRLLEVAAGLMLLALAAWSLRAPRAVYGPGAAPGAGVVPGITRPRDAQRSFLVGTVHGLAGSAAVALLLATAGRLGHGLASLLVFGAGTTLGMGLLAGVGARALTAAARRGRTGAGPRALHAARTVSAAASVVIGGWLVFSATQG